MDADFERFERKVEEIGNIVQGLNSNYGEEENEAKLSSKEEEFDELQVTDKFDVSCINKKYCESSNKTQTPESFMAFAEKDAKDRADDRRRRTELASKYRSSAHNAFTLGDFAEAVDLYSKAINEVNDDPALYICRTVSYLKLGLHKRMIHDCDLALRLHENCMRAWLLKARALFELDEVEEADKCVEEARKRTPHRKADIEAYVALWRWRDVEK